jgi:hypothetical protein
MNYESDWY